MFLSYQLFYINLYLNMHIGRMCNRGMIDKLHRKLKEIYY